MPKRLLAITALPLFAASLGGCSLLPKEEQALKPPLVKPVEETYNTAKVTRGTIAKEIRGSATFESTHMEYAQFTEQGGRVKQLAVKSGEDVKKGDLLVQLDVEGLDLKLKEQELALERAKIALKKVWVDEGKDADSLRIATLQVELEQLKYDRLLQAFTGKRLTAKMDGKVIHTAPLALGDMVGAHQTLVIIADPSQLRLSMRVDNMNDIGEVMPGMAAAINPDKENFAGTVVQTPSSAPVSLDKAVADKNAKTLYITLPSQPPGVEIGTNVFVSIPTQKREDVLKIPRSGLRQFLGRTFVQVLEGKALREIDVETGLQISSEVEIVRGLKEGQDIVLN